MSRSDSEIPDDEQDVIADVTAEYGPLVEMPARVGLCPIHAEQYWMPLHDDEECPTCPECPMPLVIYERRWSS